jgi:hypothetical protein
MSKVTEDLKKIVDQVAREGALTPDAIRQFDVMRENLERAEREKEGLTKQRDELHEKLRVLTKDHEVLGVLLKVRIEDCDRYAQREMEFNRMSWLFQHEQDRRMDMRSIISEVFRNFETARTFSKSLMGAGPPQWQGGPPGNVMESHSETERHKQE